MVVSELVRKALIVVGSLAYIVLTFGFFFPIQGRIALDAACADYVECKRNAPIIDCAPGPCPAPLFDCLVAYSDRKESIGWRYFFFLKLLRSL